MSLNRSTCSSDGEVSYSEELSLTLDRIRDRIHNVRENYRQQLYPTTTVSTPNSPSRGGGTFSRFLGGGRSRRSTTPDHENSTASTTPERKNGQKTTASPSPSPLRPTPPIPGPVANFIPFSQCDEFIEDLRRVAELCIIGENYVASMHRKEQESKRREKARWEAARNAMLDDVTESDGTTRSFDDTIQQQQEDNGVGPMNGGNTTPKRSSTLAAENDDRTLLFDLFFERNALAMIVDMLYGESFRIEPPTQPEKNVDDSSSKLDNGLAATTENNNNDDTTTTKETLLPPLSIATQALQSISILIQNVSRATSLYVILSNNYINKLINLPFDLYTTAEKRRLIATRESKSLPAAFASPQITEVATHFVTFLKSLALRINAETLQFFLTYPQIRTTAGQQQEDSSGGNLEDDGSDGSLLGVSLRSTDDSNNSDDDGTTNIEFPLYLRALEFCAAHQDSFVRTTAMNICLNTLRLTTIVGPDDDESQTIPDSTTTPTINPGHQASPDGVLHNARPLPYHERLAIARYACIPSRVEHLISPIFTKLAEHWSAIDEQIVAIDTNKHMGFDGGGGGMRNNDRVTQAKEKVRRDRMMRTFKDKVADLQDELLLLDDVFKVGLVVLNEQLVETMLATFVYPMLLQPLVIYCQQLSASVDEDRFSFSDHPFGGVNADLSDVDKSLLAVSTPAKAALYTLASVFMFQSNRALLRLLFTALFHPLSPDSTSAPTVRSKLDVATVDPSGKKSIRLDRSYPLGERIPDERTTYDFGTSPLSRRKSKPNIFATGGDNEACIFVLSPALAEVLEFRGDDIALIARTRPNPYRRALLTCLTVPDDMSDIRELTVCVFAAALSSFEGKFGSRILLGTDLKKLFANDIPADERNLDSVYAHTEDNRGIGGNTEYDSRHTLKSKRGSIGSDHLVEAVSALCQCVVYAFRVASDEWKLGYNNVAAHALLSTVDHHPIAIAAAAKIMEVRYRQAAIAIVQIPGSGLIPMGGSSLVLPGSPSINDYDYEEQMFGCFLNLVMYDAFDLGGAPVLESLLQPKDTIDTGSREGYLIEISSEGSVNMLNSCIGKFLLTDHDRFGIREFGIEMIEERRESSRAWLKVDALLTLLKDLAASPMLSVTKMAFSVVDADSDNNTGLMYSYISSDNRDFFCWGEKDEIQLQPRSVMDLTGSQMIPCVCEIAGPAVEFFRGDDGAGSMISEGVSWQSLYVVLTPHETSYTLVLAQPLVTEGDRDGRCNGRVISVCPMERLTVERDPCPPDDGSPARRLSLYYNSFHQIPPPLFLFDTVPEPIEHSTMFHHVKPYISRLDVWFENEYTADYAYATLSTQIFLAKSSRGRRIHYFLDPNSTQPIASG